MVVEFALAAMTLFVAVPGLASVMASLVVSAVFVVGALSGSFGLRKP